MLGYKHLAKIRVGKETTVWRSRSRSTGEGATVKELAGGIGPEQAEPIVARLHREYEFLHQLSHPNLLRPISWIPEGRACVFHDTQGSLAQLADRHGRLDYDLTSRVMLDCLQALAYLHERQLAHGSLSPRSMLLDPPGNVVLGDFTGFRFDRGEAPVPPESPRKYLAPEFIDARLTAGADPSRSAIGADLYALGYAALELMTGADFPFLFTGGEEIPVDPSLNWLTWHAAPDKKLPDLKPLLAGVPQEMIALLEGLTRKRPQDRAFSSAEQVISYLLDSKLASNRVLPPVYQGSNQPIVRKTARVPGIRRRACPILELRQVGEPGSATRFLPGRPSILGREARSALRLEGPEIADKHALLVCQESGRWWIYDLNSSTGVVVNGKPIEGHRIRPEDQVCFGATCFEVRLIAAEPREQRIGPFKLIRELHRGHRGVLYLAEWVENGSRPVALRVFPGHFQHDGEAVERFLRSASIWGKIRHPNLVEFYRGGRISRDGQSTWFLAMEYLPGGSLDRRLSGLGPPLLVPEVLRLGRDICRAIIFLGERGLVHGNVNPSCILHDSAGNAKLSTYPPIQSDIEAEAVAMARGGIEADKLAYQAPEQGRGASNLGPSVDLHGLAACIHHALTLVRTSAPGETLGDDLERGAGPGSIPPIVQNPSIPPALNQCLVECLGDDPTARPPSARSLLDQLEAALATWSKV